MSYQASGDRKREEGMGRTLAVTALLVLAVTSSASALSSPGRNDWTTLSAEKLQQLPRQVVFAIRVAQKACGDDEPRVRTGFLRYLKSQSGEEFISLHFDQFHCNRHQAICNSAGCLHRVFVSTGRHPVREVWHGQAYDIDLENQSARPSLNVHCESSCTPRLQWNGQSFLQR